MAARPLPPARVSSSYAKDQNSPLHAACYRGDYDEALMLLLRGADVHALNVWRETPLHQCTNRGHLDLMLLLLDAGAHVNALDHQNITPLHQAVIHANKQATELLLCYGASVYNADHVTDTLAVVQLAESVHVCHTLVTQAVGRVLSLQHWCRLALRRSLGAKSRTRLKELPLPRHLISYVSTLPLSFAEQLHLAGDRLRIHKAEGGRMRSKVIRGQRSIGPVRTSETL